MIFETVGRNTDDLDVALGKVTCTTGDLAKLSRADRGKVSGMREEDGLGRKMRSGWAKQGRPYPGLADPFVEIDWASRSLSLEIGGDTT